MFLAKMVRFRADPAKLRVSIRRTSNIESRPGWMVTIQERPKGPYVVWWDEDPVEAMCGCMEAARCQGLSGLDFMAKGAYPHPQS